MKVSKFYRQIGNAVICTLCNHSCKISEGKEGICGVRKNIDGQLFSTVYGKLVAKNIDPVEKKPLYHFLPGTYTYSISTVGCNFRCLHCQNHEISQVKDSAYCIYASPEDIVRELTINKIRSISYTYTEPTVYYEYARDIGILAKENGIKNIFVSNGFMSEEVIEDLSLWLDAINIDIKSFSETFYKEICGARLKPVLENVERLKANGIWVEITTLIIPDLNDSEKELKEIAKFIKSVDDSIPWHVSAFYPTYKLTYKPPTPPQKILKAREIGLEMGLKYVYTGNIRDPEGANTYCPDCGEVLIRRMGYFVELEKITSTGECANCGYKIEGVFS